MKTNEKRLALLVISFCFFNVLRSQEARYPETVSIKIYESFIGAPANLMDSKMVIVDADNVITTVPLKPSFRLIDNNEEFDQNQVKVRIELQKLNNKGFLVKGYSSASPLPGFMVTSIVMQKD
ncbi:MAG: hypothetical protein V4635_04890 [Bacteroidota bacterium]